MSTLAASQAGENQCGSKKTGAERRVSDHLV